jgi:hypothetical protein
LGQAMNPGGGEGHAVVGANGARQPVLPEQAVEDGPHAVAFGREQTMAGQEIPGVLVGNRQGVAVDAIARAEVALEIGGPEIVGLRGGHRNNAGMLIVAPSAPLLHQAPPRQEIAGGADRRPLQARLARPQPGQEFGRSPARMLPPRRTDHRGDVPRDTVGAVMRRPAAITQAAAPAFIVAGEPFVAGLAADAVAGAQFGHGIQVQPVITNEPLTLFHG